MDCLKVDIGLSTYEQKKKTTLVSKGELEKAQVGDLVFFFGKMLDPITREPERHVMIFAGWENGEPMVWDNSGKDKGRGMVAKRPLQEFLDSLKSEGVKLKAVPGAVPAEATVTERVVLPEPVPLATVRVTR